MRRQHFPSSLGPFSGCLNSAFLDISQHFSTFYGPSVKTMDTQLHALPTLAVVARTVSGCLHSAFFGLGSGSGLLTRPSSATADLPGPTEGRNWKPSARQRTRAGGARTEHETRGTKS